MNFLKKQSAGFYMTAITLLCAIAGMIFYLVNCNTAYFSNLGVNAVIVACLAIAVLLELVMIIASNKAGNIKALDVIPVLCGVLIMAALVTFISVRVNSIATILSFERNDQTMADLSSAIVGMGCCLAAVIFNMIASFLKITRETEKDTIKVEMTTE